MGRNRNPMWDGGEDTTLPEHNKGNAQPYEPFDPDAGEKEGPEEDPNAR